ncbi:INO80 complex subunit E [Brevipalpus obovatus]|uniref:INO80 complex subunit E n=1 Tax=Brevipalpus obovatus TaxID=246614 RepID=UPI003D9F5B25
MPPIRESTDHKKKYRDLKRKLKLLIYENECLQEELRTCQRKMLDMRRDNFFLLEKLLKYEDIKPSSSDSDATESSDRM